MKIITTFRFLIIFLTTISFVKSQAQCTTEDLNNFTVEQVDASCITNGAIKISYSGTLCQADGYLVAKIMDAARKQSSSTSPIVLPLNSGNSYTATSDISYGEYTVTLEFSETGTITSTPRDGVADTHYFSPLLELVNTKPPFCTGANASDGSEIKVKIKDGTGNYNGNFTYEIEKEENNTYVPLNPQYIIGPTPNRTVTFENLPPGKYKIKVGQNLGGPCTDGNDINVNLPQQTETNINTFYSSEVIPGCSPNCDKINGRVTIQTPDNRQEFIDLINDNDITNDPILFWYQEEGSSTWTKITSGISALPQSNILRVDVYFPYIPDNSIIMAFLRDVKCGNSSSFDPNSTTNQEKENLKKKELLREFDNRGNEFWSNFRISQSCGSTDISMIIREANPFSNHIYTKSAFCIANNTTLYLERKLSTETNFSVVETIQNAITDNAQGATGTIYPGASTAWPGKIFNIEPFVKQSDPEARYRIRIVDECGRERYSRNYSQGEKIIVPTLSDKLKGMVIPSDNPVALNGTGAIRFNVRPDYGTPPFNITITRKDGQNEVPITTPQNNLSGSYVAQFPIKLRFKTEAYSHDPNRYVSDLPPGVYNVKIEDGCGTTAIKEINITELANSSVNIIPIQSCTGSVKIEVSTNIGIHRSLPFILFKQDNNGDYKPLKIRSDNNVYAEDQQNIPANTDDIYTGNINFNRLIRNGNSLTIGNLAEGNYRVFYYPTMAPGAYNRSYGTVSAANPNENFEMVGLSSNEIFSHKTNYEVYDSKTLYNEPHNPIYNFHKDFKIKNYAAITPTIYTARHCNGNKGSISLDIPGTLSQSIFPLTFTISKPSDSGFSNITKTVQWGDLINGAGTPQKQGVTFENLDTGAYQILFSSGCNTNGINLSTELTNSSFVPPMPTSNTNGFICENGNTTLSVAISNTAYEVHWYDITNGDILPPNLYELGYDEAQVKLQEVWNNNTAIFEGNEYTTSTIGKFRVIYRSRNANCSNIFYFGDIKTTKAIDKNKVITVSSEVVCGNQQGEIIIEDAEDGVIYTAHEKGKSSPIYTGISDGHSLIELGTVSRTTTYEIFGNRNNCTVKMGEVTIQNCDQLYVTTWKTTQENEEIYIPTFSGETYKYNILWENIEDSSIKGELNNQTGNATITFGTPGRYRVKIYGKFPRIYFNNIQDENRKKILTVEQWGSITWTSQENAYDGCENLRISATDKPILTLTKSLENMFKDAYSMNEDISSWDVSEIENMSGMFHNARSFNQNLGDWDMSNVNNVDNMFLNSNMSANKMTLTLKGWSNGTNDLSIATQQTLGDNLRYCDNENSINIANLTMPTASCNLAGVIYLEQTNTGNNNSKRLAGVLKNGAFEWLEEDFEVNNLSDAPETQGIFKFVNSNTQGTFNFNGITLNMNKLAFSNNSVLRGFGTLDNTGIYPLANVNFTYKKTDSEDGYLFVEVRESITDQPLTEEGIIVYDKDNGHFYESIKLDSNNHQSESGSLKWVRIDN